MIMYYVMLELVPKEDNEEKNIYKGAFLNCWTYVKTKREAIDSAKKFANEQGWDIIKIKKIYIANKERYDNDKEILEVYNEACNEGVSGILYTW